MAVGVPGKKCPNLWTMWKTQESSTESLWITLAGALLGCGWLCYNRLRSLERGSCFGVDKTAGRRGCGGLARISRRCPSVIIHSAARAACLLLESVFTVSTGVQPFSTVRLVAERAFRVRERCHLLVRLVFDARSGKSLHRCGKSCGQRGKPLFTVSHTRRLKCRARLRRYASEQRFCLNASLWGLWMIVWIVDR